MRKKGKKERKKKRPAQHFPFLRDHDSDGTERKMRIFFFFFSAVMMLLVNSAIMTKSPRAPIHSRTPQNPHDHNGVH